MLVSAIACSGSDSSTGPRNRNPAGTYALLQVDSKKIPTVVFRGPFTFPQGQTTDRLTVTITGGELILQNDGSVHAAIDYRAEANGQELTGTTADDGNYEIQGNQIQIANRTGGMIGSYRNGVIALTIDPLATGQARTYAFRYVP